MGNIGRADAPVTKTTNAILVLPGDHLLVEKKRTKASISLKRAASICCQCQMCTDLCPRHALGHPIQPHLFMRAASNKDFQDLNPFVNTHFCSSCGVCELYACPQGLAPRSLMAEYKAGLRSAGVKPPKDPSVTPVQPSRELRKVPEHRLEARLGLSKYNVDAPLKDEVVQMGKVRILLGQHIGAPAKPVVKEGDMVEVGQMIGKPADGLSVGIHASISGKVVEADASHVTIQKA